MRPTVAFLHDMQEEANLSMKLYADRLAASMEGRWVVRHVFPWASARGTATSERGASMLLAKARSYFARYAVYPLSVLGYRADVFHIVDHAYAHLLACLPARRSVVTCHDLMLLKLARGDFAHRVAVPRVAAGLLRVSVGFLRRAGRVVAVSRATGDDLVRILGLSRNQIEVVYSGVERSFSPPSDSATRQAARARFGLDARPALLHVGGNWFYKNMEAAIQALALVRASNGNAPVLLKAGGRLSNAQRMLIERLGLSDRVYEVGLLSVQDLRMAYWAADALVFPSLWEGFGWPVLEAMASGTPVICSDRGGLGETAPGAAALVDPNDSSSIAEAIERVLGDRAYRRELVEAGLDRVRQFSWERTGEQMSGIYEAVARAAS